MTDWMERLWPVQHKRALLKALAYMDPNDPDTGGFVVAQLEFLERTLKKLQAAQRPIVAKYPGEELARCTVQFPLGVFEASCVGSFGFRAGPSHEQWPDDNLCVLTLENVTHLNDTCQPVVTKIGREMKHIDYSGCVQRSNLLLQIMKASGLGQAQLHSGQIEKMEFYDAGGLGVELGLVDPSRSDIVSKEQKVVFHQEDAARIAETVRELLAAAKAPPPREALDAGRRLLGRGG